MVRLASPGDPICLSRGCKERVVYRYEYVVRMVRTFRPAPGSQWKMRFYCEQHGRKVIERNGVEEVAALARPVDHTMRGAAHG